MGTSHMAADDYILLSLRLPSATSSRRMFNITSALRRSVSCASIAPRNSADIMRSFLSTASLRASSVCVLFVKSSYADLICSQYTSSLSARDFMCLMFTVDKGGCICPEIAVSTKRRSLPEMERLVLNLRGRATFSPECTCFSPWRRGVLGGVVGTGSGAVVTVAQVAVCESVVVVWDLPLHFTAQPKHRRQASCRS